MMHNSGSASGNTAVAASALSRGPQPAWMTLNDARERSFTGEIVFEIEPEVRAYLDNGVVYFAERSTDGALGERLLAAGLVDHTQLERGTVRVGEVEHLGRLFDRDDTVDRDAILVLTETETEMLVAEIANEAFCTVRSTAYRHHPSGLHRWFAAPIDATADRRFAGISSLDTSLTNDIPCLPIVAEHTLADQLHIEWDEPIIGGARVIADEPVVDSFDDSLLQAMLDEAALQYDAIESDEVTEIDTVVEIATVDIGYDEFEEPEAHGPADLEEEFDVAGDTVSIEFSEPVETIDTSYPSEQGGDGVDDEFVVVWPSGAVDLTVVEAPVPAATEVPAPNSEAALPIATISRTVEPQPSLPGVAPQSAEELAMTPIDTFDEEIVAEVPTDVANAVKRAIAALERITGEHPVIAPILQPSEFEDPHAVRTAPTPFAAFGGFPPPSLDMSAEAIYARATAAMEAEAAAAVTFDSDSVVQPSHDGTVEADADRVADMAVAPEHVAQTGGVASVVFVDEVTPEDSDGDSNERSSALRRLIGSLRRKDR